MYLGLFSFGGGEIFIVLIAVLVLFGANKIPELARMMGKGMNEFKRATDDIKKEFREGADEFKKDLDEGKQDVENHIHEISESISKEVDDYNPYEDLSDINSNLLDETELENETSSTEPKTDSTEEVKKEDSTKEQAE